MLKRNFDAPFSGRETMTKTLMTTSMLSVLFLVAQPVIGHHDGPHNNGDKRPSPLQMMRAMDTDGDGLISFEEFQSPDKRRGADRLDEADADGDGNISRAEMEAQLNAHLEAVKAKAEARFEQADINDDGFVTPEERKQVAFEMLDINGDGYLSPDELAAAQKNRRRPQD
jgi:Ca2+-binding EF-hand superfamily protein